MLSFFQVEGGTGIVTDEIGECGCGRMTSVFVNRKGRTQCLSCAGITRVDLEEAAPQLNGNGKCLG